MDDNDPNYKAAGMGFDDKSIRAGFIRRVYSILSVSALMTLLVLIRNAFEKQTNFGHDAPVQTDF